MTLESELQKIRQQTNSGLENQRQVITSNKVAVLLKAVEETILEQNQPLAPIAYFGTLMTIVEDSAEKESTVVVSATYLLAVVFPFLSTNVLKLKFVDIATLLEGILLAYKDNAAVVKSITGCLEMLLFSQDSSVWTSQPLSRNVFQHLLSLVVDPRPKVRKRAIEAVRKIVGFPPAPSKSHPLTPFTIDFCLLILQNDSMEQSQWMDTLVFLKMMAPLFVNQSKVTKVGQKLASLVEALLKLPIRTSGGGDVILTQWIFEVLGAILAQSSEEHVDFRVVYSMVRALLQLSPNENDKVLAPLWLRIMSQGFSRLSEFACDVEIQSEAYLEDEVKDFTKNQYNRMVSDFFSRVFGTWLNSKQQIKPEILKEATSLLSCLFEECVSNSMVVEMEESNSFFLQEMLKHIEGALTTIHFSDKWGHILQICVSIFHRLGQEHSQLVENILISIMAFRDDPSYGNSFPYKKELEMALHAAVQTLGLERFVTLITLNIENEFPEQPRRPYLLATFAGALQTPAVSSSWVPLRILGPHNLSFYVSHFLTLADRMLKKCGELWAQDKQLEAKVYETIGLQIWTLFPALCASLPNDVPQSFGLLAPHLGKVLTTIPAELYPNLPSSSDLRPAVCQGLENLVETFFLLDQLTPEEDDDEIKAKWKEISKKVGSEALSKIKSFSNRFLSALCNIYITIDPNISEGKATGQALQVLHEKSIQHFEKPIRKFLQIAEKKAVADYMLTLVKSILQKQQNPKLNPLERLSIYIMMDLILILLPELEPKFEDPIKLYYKVCIGQLATSDSTLQKKTYKSLAHIVQHVTVESINESELASKLVDEEVTESICAGAIRQRVQLIQLIVQETKRKRLLLEFIPRAISEIMLATKEASEKTRDVAYDCLVCMAKKMMSGADSLYVDGIDSAMDSMVLEHTKPEDGDEEIKEHKGEISIREFMLMVSAGLDSDSSHVQSASIASLGRLMFEFSHALEPDLVQELITTMLVCMELKNREVTKACLGFLKVVIVCLPTDLMELSLETVIETILAHSQDFKSHFKSKIRHIFERLIRKFSYEQVDQYFPEEHKKLIQNIKKRRENLKRRKQAARQESEVDTKETKKKFEEAFQDSDSELESDEDYIPDQFKEETVSKKPAKTQMVIREDEVVDFLDKNVVSQISHIQKKKQSKGSDFKTVNGKMVVADSDDDEASEPEVKEDLYKESLQSEMAFTRGPDGRVKFLKRKRGDEQHGDEKTTGQRWNQNSKNKKEKKDVDVNEMLGRRYKAKRAKGDVKLPNQPDPYAYIPLNGKIVGNMHKSTKLDGKLQNILKAAQKGGEVGTKQKKTFKGVSKQNKKHNK